MRLSALSPLTLALAMAAWLTPARAQDWELLAPRIVNHSGSTWRFRRLEGDPGWTWGYVRGAGDPKELAGGAKVELWPWSDFRLYVKRPEGAPAAGQVLLEQFIPGARRHIDAIAVQPYQAGHGQARAIVIAERLDAERMVGSPELGHGPETKGSLRTVASTRLWRLEPGRPIRLLAGQELEREYPEGDPLSTDGAGKGARFRDPIQAMAMNAEGVVFLIEGLPLQIHQNAIRKVAPDGTVTTLGSGHGYRGLLVWSARNMRNNSTLSDEGLAIRLWC